MAAVTAQPRSSGRASSAKRSALIGKIIVNTVLALICILWTIPTLGLLVSSFRTRFDIQTSGWWQILPHRSWQLVEEFKPDDSVDRSGVMEFAGAKGTFEELREGVTTSDGKRVRWVGNRRAGRVQIEEQNWTVLTDFTLSNYENVLTGKEYILKNPDGSELKQKGDDMGNAFLNSLAVVIPSTVIPILLAAFAAYAFAWMRFPGRKYLFILVVALLVVPLQIALIPILQDYQRLQLTGTFLAVWLAHTGFGLSLATYLLYNYIAELPRDILESAFIDGASHFTTFMRLILPLTVPALASFAIFQFLWVWNDYLISMIFLGGRADNEVMTMRLAGIVGSRGNDWHLLTAGAFVTMVLPLIVFFSLQRFFVRGLLAGSVKG